MSTQVLRVAGMTCGHCSAAVTKELSALSGVSDISVSLAPGEVSEVTVTSAEPLTEAAARDAVDEAGYELVALVGSVG